MNEYLPAWLAGIRNGQREQQRLQLAAQLAEELKEGDACPVCGSCSHPLLHGNSAVSARVHPDDEAATSWEKALQQTQKLLLRVAPLRSKAETALERFQEVILSASAIEESTGSTSAARFMDAFTSCYAIYSNSFNKRIP